MVNLSLFLPDMQTAISSRILVENILIHSEYLNREVLVDFYLPANIKAASVNLLLINDGQDLLKFNFHSLLEELVVKNQIEPVLCAGIHCGQERRMEYGTVSHTDFKGRGAKAAGHENFVLKELVPFIQKKYSIENFKDKSYAGFSLGGLSALDTVWNHPGEFSRAGVFSGSLWWRLRALDDGYVEETDRIMHKLVRESEYKPGLKFYFTTGSYDEKMDRNNNGVIDSIDDTQALIIELEKKGYDREKDICYINYDNGRHDVFTWGKAMPDFLRWGWACPPKL